MIQIMIKRGKSKNTRTLMQISIVTTADVDTVAKRIKNVMIVRRGCEEVAVSGNIIYITAKGGITSYHAGKILFELRNIVFAPAKYKIKEISIKEDK